MSDNQLLDLHFLEMITAQSKHIAVVGFVITIQPGYGDNKEIAAGKHSDILNKVGSCDGGEFPLRSVGRYVKVISNGRDSIVIRRFVPDEIRRRGGEREAEDEEGGDHGTATSAPSGSFVNVSAVIAPNVDGSCPADDVFAA